MMFIININYAALDSHPGRRPKARKPGHSTKTRSAQCLDLEHADFT